MAVEGWHPTVRIPVHPDSVAPVHAGCYVPGHNPQLASRLEITGLPGMGYLIQFLDPMGSLIWSIQLEAVWP